VEHEASTLLELSAIEHWNKGKRRARGDRALSDMLAESDRLVDGTFEVAQMWLHLLREVQDVLAL
jgi:hypothetical protein